MRSAKNILILVWLILAFAVPAQTKSVRRHPPLTVGAPEKVGMSSERLQRIDHLCEKAVADGDVPGIVALVARRSRIVYHKAFGMADTQSGRKLKDDDIFRIASQSKAITATAVMMLWEEGKFRLDDPISKFIPEFKDPQVLKTYTEADGAFTTEPARSEISIRHLLTHTSGIGYGVIDGDERFKKMYARAGVVDLFTTEPVTIAKVFASWPSSPCTITRGKSSPTAKDWMCWVFHRNRLRNEVRRVPAHAALQSPGNGRHLVLFASGKAGRLVPVQSPKMANGSDSR